MTDPAAATFSLAELRDAAEHDGESATTVYVGGPGWDAVLALVDVAEAANDLSFTASHAEGWNAAFDKLLTALSRFKEAHDPR